ncbi:MAG: hypothetical protein J7L23_03335 [Candidatus Diapherotrites archaeon]|nr:hypothetical protein [Candidatus Diapherotrites archaeon]
MMDRPIGLMVIVIILSVVTKVYWLAILVGIAALLVAIASIEIKRPSPVPSGGKEEEILTPVIVQDVGEPPYLYPPNFDLKLKPNESLMPLYDIAAGSFGKLFRAIYRTARGDSLRNLSPKKVKWR